MKVLFCILFLIHNIFGSEIFLQNHCHFTVWPGIYGLSGASIPDGGGLELKTGQSYSFKVPEKWGGRIWGRTNCTADGRCLTGDCGNRLKCGGLVGAVPHTVAEIVLKSFDNQDFYDVSHVDGFNLPMSLTPMPGTFKKVRNDHFDCNPITCSADMNLKCPPELAVKSGTQTISCMSACNKYKIEEYCCNGAHNTPQTCNVKSFPHNYPAYFKGLCHDAYSYAYDDPTSTFTCHGNPQTSYTVVFCP